MKNKRSQISRQERRRRQRQALRQRGARALGLESLEARYALASVPILVDLNANGPSTPSDFIEVNGVTYFVATNAANGRELWKTDGTTQGTTMLVDVNVGAGSSDPSSLVNVNGVIYFAAKNASDGRELWRTDGTVGGTYMVKDLFTGTYQANYQQVGNSSNPTQLTNVSGKLFFTARNGSSGVELWSSDGTSAGTAMVKNIYADGGATPSSSSPTQLTNYNGALYFVADDGQNGRELWKSDGTEAGTVMVKNIHEGTYQYTPTGGGSAQTRQNSAHPGLLRVLNGQLYFVANDGTHGAELWKTDGTTAGTSLVKDIRSGTASAFTSSSLMEVVGNLLLFSANDGATGDELWRSDGTAAGTSLLKDLRPGAEGDLSYFGAFSVIDNVLYFAGNDGTNGKELWKSDGTAAGTVMLADIWTGSFASGESSQGPHGSLPAYITNVNGMLYFSAFTGEAGRELWKYTPAGGATLVADAIAGGNSIDPTFITEVNGRVFFSGNVSSGKELFTLAEAESYQLSIYVDGVAVTVPSTVGVKANGEIANNFTTAAGKVNYTSGAGTKLGDFFNVWKNNAGLAGNNANAVLSSTQILGNVATSEKTVQMFVNGQIIRSFADYVVQPGDDIVIIYGSNPVIALNTTYGTILMELFEDDAPNTVKNFLNYVNDGDYKDTIFHRADDDWVIQGGGFKTNSTTFTNVSQFTAIPTDPAIQNEFKLSNVRGTIAMAKGTDPNSATSQFFVNLSDNTSLDLPANGAFTVFGKVLSMTTVEKIENLPINSSNDVPFKELPVGADGKLAVISSIQGLGDVTGVRFVDLNSNGVQDSGEEGLAGAVVYVDGNNNGVHDSGEASTITDDDGKYRLQLAPGTYTIRIVASARGNQTLPAAGTGHTVTVEIGEELTRNFAESINLSPSGVVLAGVSDTGESNSDRITNLNNVAGKQLQFVVSGVAPGGVVKLYSGDTLIGSATATGSSVTITTNGAATLTDGLHEIYARQTLSGVESPDSVAVIVTIDTTTPADISTTPTATVELGGSFSYDAASTDEGDADTTYALVNAPTGMTINPTTGVIQWTPAADQAKTYQFAVRLEDKAGNATQQSMRLTVTGALDVLPDDYSVSEEGTLTVPKATGVRANDENPNSQTATVTLVSNVSHGTLTLNEDGSFTYTPNNNFSGVDSFTYTAADGALQGNETTVTINVTAANDPPVGVADSYQTNEDTVLTVGVGQGVLANDSDPDGNSGLTVEVVQAPVSGTLELNADGSFIYTPQGDFNGAVTFTYRINDGTTTSAPITVTLTVAAVNDPPVANPDSYTVNEDGTLTVDAAAGVLSNDPDVELDAKTAEVVTNPTHGTLTLNANGSFTYTPTANYSGPDTFTYRAKDANGQSQPITVTITVTGVNDAPTAGNDTKSVANDGSTHEVDVLVNDADGPSETQTVTITAVTQGSSGGTVTISSNGSKIQYKPAASFTGTETFTYTITDQGGLTKTATVTMTVTAATTTGVISGIVFFDADNDGVRDTGEVGIPGVLVTLASTSTGTNITRSAITKSDGTYSFTALPAGTYKVTESQPMAMNDGVEKSADTGATITNDVIANIVLTSAETAANNNFGERLLKPAYTSIRWFFASSQASSNAYFREVIAQGEDNAGHTELAKAIRNGSTTFTPSASSATAAAALLAEEEADDAASNDDDSLAGLAFASLLAEEESDAAPDVVDQPVSSEAETSNRSGSNQRLRSSDLEDDATFDLLDAVDGASIEEEIDALDEAFAELQSWRAA